MEKEKKSSKKVITTVVDNTKKLKDNKGNIIRESSIIELMHQKGITREEAIEFYIDPV